jgi:hypothetical protein
MDVSGPKNVDCVNTQVQTSTSNTCIFQSRRSSLRIQVLGSLGWESQSLSIKLRLAFVRRLRRKAVPSPKED